jgi:hypothetical protein
MDIEVLHPRLLRLFASRLVEFKRANEEFHQRRLAIPLPFRFE